MAEKKTGRILAIDWGERRMGLALSDPLGLTAQGLPTAERRSKREDLNFLESLARRHAVTLILVGNPLNMDGSEGPPSAKVHAFAAEVARRVGVAVELWDERLTSVEAESRLGGIGKSRALRLPSTSLGTGRSGQADRTTGRAQHRAQHHERVDQLAATVLLQSYLDTRCSGGEIRAATARERAPSPSSGDSPNFRKRPASAKNREGKR